MSRIALTPDNAGTGTFTIAAPGTNTDRTLTLPDATTTLVGTNATQTLTNKTLTIPSLSGTPIEQINTLSGTSVALNPDNGSIQLHTLTGTTTYTDSFASGEAITIMIDDGSAFTVTWPTMTWVNNGRAAPTLATTGFTVVALWKVSTTLYGALVGNGA
jgi:hypothetical protein